MVAVKIKSFRQSKLNHFSSKIKSNLILLYILVSFAAISRNSGKILRKSRRKMIKFEANSAKFFPKDDNQGIYCPGRVWERKYGERGFPGFLGFCHRFSGIFRDFRGFLCCQHFCVRKKKWMEAAKTCPERDFP